MLHAGGNTVTRCEGAGLVILAAMPANSIDSKEDSKMKKRLLRTAVLGALAVSVAVPALAADTNELFGDVPTGHWAYDAVMSLADAGLVEGYEDGSFGGDRQMTRYEMAKIIDNLREQTDVSDEQKALIDDLAAEFAGEIDSLQDEVGQIRDEQERIKVSGDTRVRYAAIDDNGDKTDYRARVNVDAKVSDKVAFNARLATDDTPHNEGSSGVVLDTANVETSLMGIDTTIGRQDLVLGNGLLIDDTFNGIAAEKGGFKAFYGKYDGTDKRGEDYKDTLFGAEFATTIGAADLALDYMKADDTKQEFYGANTEIGLGDNFAVSAEFLKENESGDQAVGYGLSHKKSGLSAKYRDVEKGAFTNFSTTAYDLNTASFNDGFKGMEYSLTRDVGDNAQFNLVYQDFEKQDGTKLDGRTAASIDIRF